MVVTEEQSLFGKQMELQKSAWSYTQLLLTFLYKNMLMSNFKSPSFNRQFAKFRLTVVLHANFMVKASNRLVTITVALEVVLSLACVTNSTRCSPYEMQQITIRVPYQHFPGQFLIPYECSSTQARKVICTFPFRNMKTRF